MCFVGGELNCKTNQAKPRECSTIFWTKPTKKQRKVNGCSGKWDNIFEEGKWAMEHTSNFTL
jgi:hypothetical protein